ncbi:MAG: GNAT family N-acetyltransferase [Anaerolineales bacterium]|jgi:ribosomal protein S18 acetylase RimI-like enzyme
MSNNPNTPPTIETPKLDHIPGLRFRRFQDDTDYALIASLTQRCWLHDGLDFVITKQDVALVFENPVNFDPYQDTLLIEVNGETIGYVETTWRLESLGPYVYWYKLHLHPDWRGQGLETIMLENAERRHRQVAAQHPKESPRWLSIWAADSEQKKQTLLRSAGYRPARYFFDMLQCQLDQLPEAPLPSGLEVRPAKPDHYRAIWQALDEAFQDHWGHRPAVEADYQQWIKDRRFQPELWKVAWDGGQVAGLVINFIDPEENQRFGRNRAYAEDVAVRRPWRRRGLARALLVQSLHELRLRGIGEVALGVDTENPTGALRLYQGVGFETIKRYTTLRKPLD